MEKLMRLFCILALGAMAMTSCQLEEPVPEQEEGTRVGKVNVTVSAGLDNSPKTKSMVADTLGGKMLKFTAGDRLYVRGEITGTDPQKIVAGYLDLIGAPEAGDTCATFSGDLSVFVFSSAGTPDVYTASTYVFTDAGNPLGECNSILGTLVHKDASDFTLDASQTGSYTTAIAATVNDLMTQSLPVYGFYDNGSFPLSVGDSPSTCTPIFNVNLSGLTANAEYTLVYRNGDDAFNIDETKALGTITADGSGNAAFACYVSGTTTAGEYHGFLLTNTSDPSDVRIASLATKALASRVYNATRIAVPDINYVPLTFEAKEAGAQVSFRLPSSDTTEGDLQYRLNGGEWTNYTTSESAITLTNVGDKVQFRGKKNTHFVTTAYSDYGQFFCSDSCYVYGNIMSLITDYSSDPAAFATNLTLTGTYTLSGLFRSNTFIKNHDTNSLVLPAETLTSYCYANMFEDCTSLNAAPALPAKTLAAHCYYYMFNGCTSLTSAPALPAETLDGACYQYMFSGCTSLTTAPALPAATLTTSCYANMFMGCTSLTTAPVLPAETLAVSCYARMFWGCTSLIAAPALPAKTLYIHCYEYMFLNCTRLTTAPILAAQKMVTDCYRGMFEGCGNLHSLTCLAKTSSSDNYFNFFFFYDGSAHSGAAANGTFIHSVSRSWSNVPPGWTRMEELSTCTGNCTLTNSRIYTGTLAKNVQISIAANATVTLHNVSINADGAWTDTEHAGITCLGSATIILAAGTTNTVRGFMDDYPGIQAGPKGATPEENTTLTIQGTGTLNAYATQAAAIGGASDIRCGNIAITGGTIYADCSGENHSGTGIGAGNNASCDSITISGGNVTAKAGISAAGIGTSQGNSSCGAITITGGYVEAMNSVDGPGIGACGSKSSCGAITITGGTVTATGSDNSPGIGASPNCSCGDITIGKGITSVTATCGTDATWDNNYSCIGPVDNSACRDVYFGTQKMYAQGSPTWTIWPVSGQNYGGLHIEISNEERTWTLTPASVAVTP